MRRDDVEADTGALAGKLREIRFQIRSGLHKIRDDIFAAHAQLVKEDRRHNACPVFPGGAVEDDEIAGASSFFTV